ncbi:MAG: heme exporter protein CcmB [Gammaproteobacteria bacterium RBG_16_51_14]|nr:MAG: heme exporter protein CcmB [Gammaproteobacteria bacterium RBG_16_51_14]
MYAYWKAFVVIVSRDAMLAFRRQAELVNPLIFFIMVVTLFPFAFGSDSELLQRITAGMIWITALLASTLSLDSIFRSDFDDGSIEQIVLSRYSLILLVAAKITAHWLLTGLPLIMVAMLIGFILSLPGQTMQALLATLLLGTPVLSLIGAIAVALTVGLRSGGMLLSLLILPLYMPVLIFSMLAVENAMSELPITAELYFLAGILVLSATLAPVATASSLRIRLS